MHLFISASHKNSTFDMVLSGVFFPQTIVHTIDLVAEILRVMKPNGMLVLQEIVTKSDVGEGSLKSASKLVATLKMSGMVKISEPEDTKLSESEIEQLKKLLSVNDNIQLVRINCQKPDFEVRI